ncbi:TVP38/TMEM64 family protein [Rhizomonospora bruguierae]|uniref:TVP38/TMEM64 family protein n=1 Tax=Rhizomonospora bruguierae TaxID=1581705 RepID=UPI0035E42EEE
MTVPATPVAALAAAPVAADQRRRSARRFILLLAVIGALAGGAFLAPMPSLREIPEAAGHLGPAGPVIAVLGGALLLIAMVPRTAITLATGALFGPVGGTGYALAATLIGAVIAFALGRLLGRDFVAARVRGRLAKLDSWFERQSVLGVITVRLLPIGGFGLVSYGYGTTGARIRPYLVGTVLASIPSTVGYATVGAAAVNPHGMNWFGFAPSLLGLVATAVVVAQWRLNRRRTHRAARYPAALTAAQVVSG